VFIITGEATKRETYEYLSRQVGLSTLSLIEKSDTAFASDMSSWNSFHLSGEKKFSVFLKMSLVVTELFEPLTVDLLLFFQTHYTDSNSTG